MKQGDIFISAIRTRNYLAHLPVEYALLAYNTLDRVHKITGIYTKWTPMFWETGGKN